MDSIEFNTHDKFRNFPPLYTEQINNLTLSKQLDIWLKILNDELLSNSNLYTLGINSVESPPFRNKEISRTINCSFLALILEYLVQKQYAFYLHPIHQFCKKHNVTIWGALSLNNRNRTSSLLILQEEYNKSLSTTVRKSPRNQSDLDLLKKRRDELLKSSFSFGVFPYPVSEMANAVLECIKSQCSNMEIETVYYIFYSKRECNKDFNRFPEDHLAFLLSNLASSNKITLSFNDSIPPNSLNNKNVGIQLV